MKWVRNFTNVVLGHYNNFRPRAVADSIMTIVNVGNVYTDRLPLLELFAFDLVYVASRGIETYLSHSVRKKQNNSHETI